jgi:hypothetical protein
MAKSARTTQSVQVDGLKETLRAFNRLGKDASRELRKASVDIAQHTASDAMGAASALGGVYAAAGSSIKARSDRSPKVIAGTAKKVTKRKTSAGSIIFGAEFGGRGRATTQQFAQHRGQQGFFLWPTIRHNKARDIARYQRAMDDLVRKWSRG